MDFAPVSSSSSFVDHQWQIYAASIASLPLIATVCAMCFMEFQDRGSKVPTRNYIRRLTPELVGLGSLGASAAALLWRAGPFGFDDIPENVAGTWESINKDWPMLTSADSLFVLQAMLRLVVALSAALRAGSETSPFAGTPAVFALLGVATRLVLFGLSPTGIYHIDGPLGGLTSVIIEMAVVLPLFLISRSLTRAGVITVLTGAFVSVAVAANCRFGLAPSELAYLDTLFSLVQLLDFLAALIFVLRYIGAFLAFASGAPAENVKLPRGPSACFALVVLPMQQLLPAYFFLCAFGPPLEAPSELVRDGCPFQMMWLVGFSQVGMYLMSGALHLVMCDDDDDEVALLDDPLLRV